MVDRLHAQHLAAALVVLIAFALLPGGSAAGQTSSGGLPDVTLSMSVLSLTERDGSTDVTVTAVLREPSPDTTTIHLSLRRFPLLTPGVERSATPDADYAATFTRNVIEIPPGSLTGTTTFAIDPVYDTRVEGDEAVVLTGSTAAAGVVAPTDLIIEDGPYLAFPSYIYGSLSYPDRPISITVEEAVHKAAADSTVTYALTAIDPPSNPLGLTFDPTTRELTGTAPAASGVPAAGLTTRYTITARDSAGHRATTLVSVAVVPDVCSSTTRTWFHRTEQPPAELVADCNVLLAARDTLRGSRTLNWATDTLITRPWHGIELDRDGESIRRIELQLRRLDGVIPPVLGHLSSAGPLDLVLGGDYRETLAELENKLTGPIPPELGLPPNLIVLALSYNNLSGPIPRELASNGALQFLYLHDTDKPAPAATGPEPPGVSGSIPPEFGDLPLRGLTISDNPGVGGHIPWQLGKNVSDGDHPGLQVLNLSGNSLEGNIPWQLGRFGKMQQLALSHNELTGDIPWQLGDLGNEEAAVAHRVVRLYLNGNRLIGAIPPELGGIANLETLALSENRLTGPIPPELGGLPKLRSLSLRDNWLTGGIPTELGDLGALRALYLYNNRLRGQIPADLGNLAELTGLYLDGNELDGAIPAELGQLSQLQVLSLSCNGLSGAVPASIGAITTLTELNLQGNPALASGSGERPRNLERTGLTTTWTGECRVPPPQSYGGSCLRGDVARGFSLVVHAGGPLDGLADCARARGVTALYALREGRYVSWIAGAPGFVNEPFAELWEPSAHGEPATIPAGTPLVAASAGPPSADPLSGPAVASRPGAACLRGELVEDGFSLVLYEGGTVEELAACADEYAVTAAWALHEGEWVSYIPGGPEFVNRPFGGLFAGGVPPLTPLAVRSEPPPVATTGDDGGN